MNRLDLLLVCVGNTRKKVYQTLAGEFTGIEPPSWIIITAGFVRKHGHSVRVLDANVENLDHDETVARIKAENPKL
ncbi:MAG: B12-binding domain-containing radical SAM protein, partial [Verrucomicrobia bacterium]|nr:B12-binding domain-containing radical SAM protein [Verrucomicrobiota bacterium]